MINWRVHFKVTALHDTGVLEATGSLLVTASDEAAAMNSATLTLETQNCTIEWLQPERIK